MTHVVGPPEIRGMFGPKGDSMNWLDATSRFPNGVPRFESKKECKEFMIEYNKYNGGSNPKHPQLMHIFTMLITWEEIESILIPNINKARMERSFAKKVPHDYLKQSDKDSENIYEQEEAREVVDEISFRLDLPIHKCTTQASTMNTLRYLFFHMKCGIFVMIRDGKLRIFAPFVNSDYHNTWGNNLKLEGDGSLDTYYTKKSGLCREENIVPDLSKWWANGNIICNELSKKGEEATMQHWGDHFLCACRDMLAEACNQRDMPDCEFFLNKRDYPQLKVNVPKGGIPVEPYGFIYDKDDRDPEQDVDLVDEHKFRTYAPIVSFYAAAPDRFTDVPWPSSEDWEAACGLVFPHTFEHRKDGEGTPIFDKDPRDLFTEANFRKFERAWEDNRVATAFFRGTATGGGTTIEDNQRLMVSHLSHEWKDDPEKGGDEPFLDAAITGWNVRDKKTADKPMTFIRKDDFAFTGGRENFTPIYEQSKYKYLVYVDGHCAACRYGFMMRLGSVILKVAPRQVADRMWYFPLLKPYVDHVPVKADLSDLEEKIRWCRENDDKCKQIGLNAMAFYEKYVARSALLDYVQMSCRQIAARFVAPPAWWKPPPPVEAPPKLRPPDVKCYEDKETGDSRYCVRCQKDADEEARQLEEAKKKAQEEKKDSQKSKKNARQKMLERAKKSKKQKTG